MKPLIEAIQAHVAIVAISPSTVRGQGAKGVVAAARDFLKVLPLDPFSAGGEAGFVSVLERSTMDLISTLPAGAKSWGLARKCVNIFLRDAFYNFYLRPRLLRCEP